MLRAGEFNEFFRLPAGFVTCELLVDRHEHVVFRIDDHDRARGDAARHPLRLVAPAGFGALEIVVTHIAPVLFVVAPNHAFGVRVAEQLGNE